MILWLARHGVFACRGPNAGAMATRLRGEKVPGDDVPGNPSLVDADEDVPNDQGGLHANGEKRNVLVPRQERGGDRWHLRLLSCPGPIWGFGRVDAEARRRGDHDPKAHSPQDCPTHCKPDARICKSEKRGIVILDHEDVVWYINGLRGDIGYWCSVYSMPTKGEVVLHLTSLSFRMWVHGWLTNKHSSHSGPWRLEFFFFWSSWPVLGLVYS